MFEWDERKRRTNLAKHGVDFNIVWDMEWGKALQTADIRADYGEERFIAFAPAKGRLYCCAYTEREKNKRIISLRKANKREVKYYEEKTVNY